VRRTQGFLTLAAALALAELVAPASSGPDAARADEAHGTIKSEREGVLETTPRHQLEVFFYKTGLRIFPRSTSGAPVKVSGLTGSAAFTLPGAPNPLVYPLKGSTPLQGREPESLDLAVDLSWVPVGKTNVQITVEGLADPAEGRVSFSVPFEPVKPRAVRSASDTAAYASPVTPSPSAPRYVYQAGYYGYRYYPAASSAASVAAAPAAIQYPYVAPAREVPLERPWARPETDDLGYSEEGPYWQLERE
jgi:hypothetical protein